VQGRGALRRELTACLRTGRALRVPRARSLGRGKSFIVPEIMISERPAEAADRAVPGHWEGDLILGLDSSAIGTLVERTTRLTMLLHLPRMAEHGADARIKNGPALAGHGAEAVRDSITSTITSLPEQLRRSLTWDQGAEMSQHTRLKIDTGLAVYFCDPHSPWQRGTNENTNGLLRQYFPKGTDLSAHSKNALQAVALALNTRPRKTLGWKTPAEAFDEHLRLAHMAVATTTSYTERLAAAGIEPSVGNVGDGYDNALAETINGLYKTELIHRRGPWRSFEAVELATLAWVDWFNNRRLMEPIGNTPLPRLKRAITLCRIPCQRPRNLTHIASGKPGAVQVDETYVNVKGRWIYLYRAVDSRGQTIDFLLSAKPDAEAATRFFCKALAQPHTVNPRTITVDKNAAYPKAAADMKKDGNLWRRSRLRQVKYLHNIVEQDHRNVKRLTRPGLGFGSFWTARRTLAGYEAMAMMRKGQIRNIGGSDVRAQATFIAGLFQSPLER
jgi:transposase-like protein/transposase InsO family protein